MGRQGRCRTVTLPHSMIETWMKKTMCRRGRCCAANSASSRGSSMVSPWHQQARNRWPPARTHHGLHPCHRRRRTTATEASRQDAAYRRESSGTVGRRHHFDVARRDAADSEVNGLPERRCLAGRSGCAFYVILGQAPKAGERWG